MPEKTMEQRRARAAWDAVDGVVGRDWRREYYTLAAGAPADVQTNGLGQTLAFWFAKSGKEPSHQRLLQHVSAWVLGQMGAPAGADPLQWIGQITSDEYRRATMEALAYLVWIKRFAEARLTDGAVRTA